MVLSIKEMEYNLYQISVLFCLWERHDKYNKTHALYLLYDTSRAAQEDGIIERRSSQE